MYPIKTERLSRNKFCEPFTKSGLRFQYAMDVLTEETIKSLIKNGTRIWHLSQDSDGSEGLCVERENGIKQLLSPADLKKLFKESRETKAKLKIKLVVLVFPNSTRIASVFSNEGVEHVIAFDSVQIDNRLAHINKRKLLAL